MKRFNFSLETLLVLRRAKLEQQEQHLAGAVSAYDHERQLLRANRDSSVDTWKNLPAENFHGDYLYLERLEKHGRELEEKMHEARLTMEQEQKRYADMRKELRVLEKLREKQYFEYKQKSERIQDEATAEMNRARKWCQFWGTVPPMA